MHRSFIVSRRAHRLLTHPSLPKSIAHITSLSSFNILPPLLTSLWKTLSTMMSESNQTRILKSRSSFQFEDLDPLRKMPSRHEQQNSREGIRPVTTNKLILWSIREVVWFGFHFERGDPFLVQPMMQHCCMIKWQNIVLFPSLISSKYEFCERSALTLSECPRLGDYNTTRNIHYNL